MSAPVQAGGTVRVLCDTTDDRRVLADVVAESVGKLGCGCWRVRTTRPGPDMGWRGCPRMEVIFQVCGRVHDDGSQDDPAATEHPEPAVVRHTAA